MQNSKRRIMQGLWVFFGICVFLLVIDFYIPKDHAHFEWETWPDFFGAFGLAACVILVLVAKYVLRPLVMRDEDFYD